MIFYFTIPLLLIMVLVILICCGLGAVCVWIEAHFTIVVTILLIINLITIILCVLAWLSEENKILEFFKGAAVGIAVSALLDFTLALIYGFLCIIAGILGWIEL